MNLQKWKSPSGRRKRCLALGQNSGQRLRQPQRYHYQHLASILVLILETLKALTSGNPAFVPKLTLVWNALGDFQAFQLYPVAADLRKVVLCLLHKPAVFGSSKNLG